MYVVCEEKQLYGNYRILVFLDDDKYDKSNILWYIRHLYQNDPEVEFVTIDDPAIDTINQNRYCAFYIVPEQRKLRQELRRRFRDRTGLDIHIQLYKNLVNIVNRNKYLK